MRSSRVPRITDPAEIRCLLEADRPWAAYALGDLSPGFFEDCDWFRALGGAPALALLYRAFSIPVLFTLGAPEAVRAILEEMAPALEMYLSVRPEILPLIKARYRIQDEEAMWRMVREPAEHRPPPPDGVVRLSPADLDTLQRLYADGQSTGEAPDFFAASMLARGVFFGIREGEALIAAAGTHVVSPSEGVAAIGNVYTRRDRRGQGLAARVLGAVTAELVSVGLRTLALNVSQKNEAAIRVYERLGFSRYCPFYEGLAVRCGGDEEPDYKRV
jgi:GNAT superfamily N-acetyltransferase